MASVVSHVNMVRVMAEMDHVVMTLTVVLTPSDLCFVNRLEQIAAYPTYGSFGEPKLIPVSVSV
jgi:hypothetical protein